MNEFGLVETVDRFSQRIVIKSAAVPHSTGSRIELRQWNISMTLTYYPDHCNGLTDCHGIRSAVVKVFPQSPTGNTYVRIVDAFGNTDNFSTKASTKIGVSKALRDASLINVGSPKPSQCLCTGVSPHKHRTMIRDFQLVVAIRLRPRPQPETPVSFIRRAVLSRPML